MGGEEVELGCNTVYALFSLVNWAYAYKLDFLLKHIKDMINYYILIIDPLDLHKKMFYNLY